MRRIGRSWHALAEQLAVADVAPAAMPSPCSAEPEQLGPVFSGHRQIARPATPRCRSASRRAGAGRPGTGRPGARSKLTLGRSLRSVNSCRTGVARVPVAGAAAAGSRSTGPPGRSSAGQRGDRAPDIGVADIARAPRRRARRAPAQLGVAGRPARVGGGHPQLGPAPAGSHRRRARSASSGIQLDQQRPDRRQRGVRGQRAEDVAPPSPAHMLSNRIGSPTGVRAAAGQPA